MLESTVTVPDQFAAAAATEAESEVAWWETYEDPVLSDLIRRAARENRDIKIAAERVRAARAGETISRSWLLPSFGAVGSRGNQGTDYTGRAKQAVPDMETTSGGLSVSWEVDLSGRLRSGAAAAAADKWRLKTRHGVCACWY
jgi:outer membrane protein TolC